MPKSSLESERASAFSVSVKIKMHLARNWNAEFVVRRELSFGQKISGKFSGTIPISRFSKLLNPRFPKYSNFQVYFISLDRIFHLTDFPYGKRKLRNFPRKSPFWKNIIKTIFFKMYIASWIAACGEYKYPESFWENAPNRQFSKRTQAKFPKCYVLRWPSRI